MLKPADKPATKGLVHHPSNVLDLFVQYDSTNLPWVEFSQRISEQLQDFEQRNLKYWTPRALLGERRR